MPVKYSIIIPTKGKCEELLRPLCESIIKYTNLEDVEIIIVSNGSEDNTDEYVKSLGDPFKLITFPEARGYTISTNDGIKASVGKYCILLNNDCVLLSQQPKGVWIDILVEWFLKDEKVGITGPMKAFCPEAKRDFLIGFCVMVRRDILEELAIRKDGEIQYLDFSFAPAYGEDTDLCCKIEDAGYKVVQVLPTQEYYGPNQMKGTFPIYHIGNVSFKNWPGGEDLLRRNNGILRERYCTGQPNIENAKGCDGFMSDVELRWLGKEAMNRGKK